MRRRELLTGTATLGAYAAFSRFAEAVYLGQLGAGFDSAGPLGSAIHGFHPNYFVNADTGSDSNDGRAPATAWRTLSKVNASSFVAGDVIGFIGGQTFAEGLTVPSSGSALAPIVFTSYGMGRATFAPVGAAAGLKIIDKDYVVFDNINLVGSGGATAAAFVLSANTATRTNVTLQNFTANGFTNGGAYIEGLGGNAGWSNVLIQNFTISALAMDGISVYGSGGVGIKVHQDITIKNGTIRACGHSGIYVGNTNGALVNTVVAYNNGTSSTGGAIGIWTYESNNVVIEFCESYNNTVASGSDGGGFDIDGGCTNCIVEYCYSHGNRGAGYLLWNYFGVTWNNNTVRYCISENDGTHFFYGALICGVDSGASSLTNALIYNNTFYSNLAGGQAIVGLHDAGSTGRFANNIFYSASNTTLLNSDGNTSGMLFTGNDYFASDSFAISWNGTIYPTFSAWQTATRQENISSVNVGLHVDPILVNSGGGGTVGGYNPCQPSAYMLRIGSPMFGMGLDMNAQFSIDPGRQDFYGNPIPGVSLFPVGAYAGAGV